MAGPNIRRLYFSANDVCEMTGVSPGTLKAWEVRFSNLKPTHSQTGRRLYRPNDLALVKRIKRFKDIGYTDDKVCEMLHVNHVAEVPPIQHEASVPPPSPILLPTPTTIPENPYEFLSDVKQALKELLDLLDENTHESEQTGIF